MYFFENRRNINTINNLQNLNVCLLMRMSTILDRLSTRVYYLIHEDVLLMFRDTIIVKRLFEYSLVNCIKFPLDEGYIETFLTMKISRFETEFWQIF